MRGVPGSATHRLVEDESLAGSTLLVMAHGSTVNAASAEPARYHATKLRERRLFAAVEACYWQQSPRWDEALNAVQTARVFIVPLFTGEGYFVEQVIPAALGLSGAGKVKSTRLGTWNTASFHYCRPVGTHPGMTDVLLARAASVVARYPFPRPVPPRDTALFIVGHGTERTSDSRKAVEAQVREIQRRGMYGEVHGAFMEAEPRIGDCYAMTRARYLVVVPFFISDGLHVVEDIPVLLGENAACVQRRLADGLATWRNPTERQGRLVWYAPGLGREPLLTEVILERVREADNVR